MENFGKKEKYIPLTDFGSHVKVAFDFQEYFELDEEGNKRPLGVCSWTEKNIKPRPSFSQLQQFILNEINKKTDEKILSGFVWKDMQVWLSQENQFNYKAAYDLAVQTNGANLPTVFKFGSTENPVYYKFDTIEDLSDFCLNAMKFVNEQLAIGWATKDSINWEDYKLQ